jgi:hypothetical protein
MVTTSTMTDFTTDGGQALRGHILRVNEGLKSSAVANRIMAHEARSVGTSINIAAVDDMLTF